MNDREKALEAALRDIARQRKTDEMPREDRRNGDFEGACDTMIDVARAALAMPATDRASWETAWTDVLSERKRQMRDEGWTPEHDDAHDRGELSAAAACYAHFGWVRPRNGMAPTEWPWSDEWWKPTDRRRDLVKAAALLLAEIERLDRLTPPEDAP
jgi:hypothetical protein